MEVAIHLVAVGRPDPLAMEVIGEVVADAFGVPVLIAERLLDPGPLYDSRRDQYSSRPMLESLVELIPPPDRVLGVTDVDLFMPILTFVFGEAQLGGRGAVVSLHRLHQSFYGLAESPSLLLDRAVKEALHELGHTYGLIHCRDYTCVMTASRVVDEIDLKRAEFCVSCRAKIGRPHPGTAA